MRLKSITLENFMGHRDFRLDDIGDITTIYGANWSGKSTIANGFFWCLFGKDCRGQSPKSAGRSGFDIKTIENGEVLHHLDHSVEVDFDDVTFKRTYREKWGTQNGSAKQTMTGHETVYFVDSVPVSKEQFEDRVADVCPEDRFRLFTDPLHFAGLPPTPTKSGPKSRREMLMEAFAADITDSDVIAANPELEAVPSIIGRSSVEDYRKIAEADKRRIRQLLDDIPPALKELDRTLKGLVVEKSAKSVDTIKAEIGLLQRERECILAGRDTVDYGGQIAKINAQILELEIGQRRAYDSGNSDLLQQRLKLQSDLNRLTGNMMRLRSERDGMKRDHDDAVGRRQNLLNALKALKVEEFTGSTQCKACGQELPEDRVNTVKATFAKQQAEKEAQIIADGKLAARRRDVCAECIAQFDTEIAETTAAIARVESELNAIAEPAPFKVDVDAFDYMALLASRADLQKAADETYTVDTSAVDVKIASLQAELSAAERAEQVRIESAKIADRIKELQAEDKQLSGQHEGLVYNLGLLDNFARAKNRMMVDTINGHFKLAQFVLFEEQINGGMVDCCEITLGGRPWGSMSNSERINTGLDIIQTLSKAMGIDPLPIIIDNAESVSHPFPTSGQQIQLVVSDVDKTLRVERNGVYTQMVGRGNRLSVMALELQGADEEQEEMAF